MATPANQALNPPSGVVKRLTDAYQLLKKKGAENRVQWEDVKTEVRYTETVERFELLVKNADKDDRIEEFVRLYLKTWSEKIKTQIAAVEAIRGASPKAAPPPASAAAIQPEGKSVALTLPDKETKWVIDCHNDYRKQHGADPLVFDSQLSGNALAWATGRLKGTAKGHSDVSLPDYGPLGENIGHVSWPSSDSLLTVLTSIVDGWYKESDKYFAQVGGATTGHFTQLVWKDTKKIGCGCARVQPDKKVRGAVVLVCNYSPRGNVSLKDSENVGVKKKQ